MPGWWGAELTAARGEPGAPANVCGCRCTAVAASLAGVGLGGGGIGERGVEAGKSADAVILSYTYNFMQSFVDANK